MLSRQPATQTQVWVPSLLEWMRSSNTNTLTLPNNLYFGLNLKWPCIILLSRHVQYIWLNWHNVRMPKITLYFESVFNSYGTAALCTLLIYSQIMLVWTDQISAKSFPQSSCQLWTSQHENWKWPKSFTDHSEVVNTDIILVCWKNYTKKLMHICRGDQLFCTNLCN